VTSTLQPAYLPVRLRTTTEPRGPKAEGPSRSGILALPAGTGPGHPFPSVRLHKGPGPWTDLDRLWRGASVSVEALWFAHPVGPSRSRALPPLGPHPRNDHETPLPVAAPYAWRRDLEAVRAERALGPFWEVTALVTVSAGSRDLLPPRILAEVRSWWEAVTDLPGGGGLTLRWPLALDPQKAREALLRGRPLRQWVGSSPLVTAPELALWLPEPGPPFVRQHPAPSPTQLSLLLPGGHALAPSWWVLDRKEGHHSLILGETGMGKSTLLASLALAVARPDVTVVVIDPLGPLVRGLLARLAPGPRSRVRILAPLSAPAALDPLASPAGEGDARRQRRVSEIITVLRQVRSERYGDTLFWGPRIEGLLHKVLGLLAETPGATLGEGELLLSSPERWPPARGALSLPQRERYNELVREPEENRQGVLRLLQEITHSPPLAAMLSGPGPGQLPRLVRPGSILLCDLERPAVGERVSSYLGGVLLSLLWSHLVERVETTPVVLILDEIQGYPTAALTEMLSQGRHFHLHVVAATQSLGALGPELRQALLSNARDWFLFRGTPGDLRWLEETVPGSGKVVLHLPRGEARGFLGKGERIVPVHVAPPSPLPPEQVTRAWQEALDRSRREAGPSSQRGATSEVSSTPPPLPTDLTATFARELTHWMRCRPGPPYLLPLQEVLRWVHGDERSLRRLGSLGRRTGLVVARRDLPSGPAWEIRPPAPEGPGDPGRPLTGVRQL
jgi:energy-coupling factor transporter ATP-binding protein EcfA2